MPSDRYVQKKISEVTSNDSRVSLVGQVIDTSNNFFILADDSGKIEITSDSPVERHKLVRVFCSVIDEKLKSDIVQDMSGVDLNLFKKVEELYNRAGV